MSASFVPIVIVKDSSHLGCTAASPLVCRRTVTAGRSAAKSEYVNARRSSVGFTRVLRPALLGRLHAAAA